jgi:hypothetical protein
MLKDGAVTIDLADEIIRETLVTHLGKIVNPRVAALLTQEVASS